MAERNAVKFHIRETTVYLLLLIVVYCTCDEGRHVQEFRKCAPARRGILANRDAFGNTAREIRQAIQ